MPFSIPNTTLPDQYNEAATFSGNDVFQWGFFTVANAAAFVQLAEGIRGSAVFQPEVYCPPATYPIAPGERPISGIRARNAVAGVTAQFFGSIFYPKEPGIQAGTPFTQLISPTGVVSGAIVRPSAFVCGPQGLYTPAAFGAPGIGNIYLTPVVGVETEITLSRIYWGVGVTGGNTDIGFYYTDDDVTYTRAASAGGFATPGVGAQVTNLTAVLTPSPDVVRRFFFALVTNSAAMQPTGSGYFLQAALVKVGGGYPLPASFVNPVASAAYLSFVGRV